MKPWITEASGTQKVAAPSSVCQADLATGEKLAIAASEVRSASLPLLYSSSEASKGRQVTRSPADPASRWTGANKGLAFFAYATNYLIDLDHAVIVDVEPSTAVRQAATQLARSIDDVLDMAQIVHRDDLAVLPADVDDHARLRKQRQIDDVESLVAVLDRQGADRRVAAQDKVNAALADSWAKTRAFLTEALGPWLER